MTVYTLNFNYLSYMSIRNSETHKIKKKMNYNVKTCPLVTIQLPIYNEKYVAARLINAICRLDFPKERLEIQVLDDSDDETSDIIGTLVDKYNKVGFSITVFRRVNRIWLQSWSSQRRIEICQGRIHCYIRCRFYSCK